MTLDAWLHVAHVLGAIVWLGGGLMLCVLGARLSRDADAHAVAAFGRTLSYVGPRVLTPAVLVTLLFGVWMVYENPAWDFAQTWIIIALALFAIAFVIGLAFLSRVGLALQRVADGEGDAAQSRGLLRQWVLGYSIVLVLLVIAVWDMVFKPGL
jgi:uncharacterized membrane protein